MEISVIGNAQTKFGRAFLPFSENGLLFKSLKKSEKNCTSFGIGNNVCLGGGQSTTCKRANIRVYSKGVPEAVEADQLLTFAGTSKSLDGVRLFVGLPMDVVSKCGKVNHGRAIVAGLKALKLLGVEGVELPVWWGIAEKEAMGKFEWDGYLAVTEMVQKAGLKLNVSLCFHASEVPNIELPEWVSKIGASDPDIFHADQSGQRYKACLSLAVDELPVLNGLTPIEAYSNFCENFRTTFSAFMGSTITGISVGLGPDGELRYPSQPSLLTAGKLPGVGEFQCYDKHMLYILKKQAEECGNPLWGLRGPHDASNCGSFPQSNNFFKDHGGSWETAYGDFFLSWYSNQLVSHGSRMLSIASSTFKELPVDLNAKLPLIYSWYNTHSHPSELTAGFYNTQTRNGYDAVAEIFARNSVGMVLPGIDLSDKRQPPETHSSPESLLAHIRLTCTKHGVSLSGQNSSASGVPESFEQIKKNLLTDTAMKLLSYQRMGAYFFSPEHFPSFADFTRNLSQPELHEDDLPAEHTEAIKTPSFQMQVA